MGHNLTRQTLDHRLSLRLGVVRSRAATEQGSKVLPVLVCAVLLFRSLVQSAWVRNGRRGTVAAEMAFREELNLFVVGVARDGAGGADSAWCGTGEAEVDCLSDVTHTEGAARELVG